MYDGMAVLRLACAACVCVMLRVVRCLFIIPCDERKLTSKCRLNTFCNFTWSNIEVMAGYQWLHSGGMTQRNNARYATHGTQRTVLHACVLAAQGISFTMQRANLHVSFCSLLSSSHTIQ